MGEAGNLRVNVPVVTRVSQAVRKLSGLPEGKCGLPSVRVTLKQNVRLDPERPEYHRCVGAVCVFLWGLRLTWCRA